MTYILICSFLARFHFRLRYTIVCMLFGLCAFLVFRRHCRYCIKIQYLCSIYYRTLNDIFSFPTCILLSYTQSELFFVRSTIHSFPTPSLLPHLCSLYILHHHWCLWYILYYIVFLHSSSVRISQMCRILWSSVLQLAANDRVISTCFHSNSILIMSAKFL